MSQIQTTTASPERLVQSQTTRVFVGGCQRSGTTLTASLLAQATGITFLPESPFFYEALESDSNTIQKGRFLRGQHFLDSWRIGLWGDEFKARMHELNRELPPVELFESMARLYAETIGSKSQGWLEHSPRNLVRARMLREIFPGARFVHVVRDPRSVAASLMRVNFGPTTAMCATEYWMQCVLHGTLMEMHFPDEICRVRFEDVTSDADRTIRKVGEQFGLDIPSDWQPGGRKINKKMQQHELLLQEAPNASRAESWRNELSPGQIADIEYIAGDVMESLGYEISQFPNQSNASRRYISRAFDGMKRLFWQFPLRVISRS